MIKLRNPHPGRAMRVLPIGLAALVVLAGCDKLLSVLGPGQVTTVVLTPARLQLRVGASQQLTADPQDANGRSVPGQQVTWSSTNTALATVDGSGKVTGVAVGQVTITAACAGKTGSASVTVLPAPVASVAVTPASATVQQGLTVQLTATPKDASGNPLTGRVVTWASTNLAVATVDANGVVTGVALGSATITATSEGQSGTSTITVTNVSVPVASVAVSPSSGSVVASGTLQLTATPKDASGNPLSGRVVTWASGNTAIATVSPNGLVTGVAAGGPVTITATSEGKSGTAAITVTAPATGLFAIGDSVLVTVAAWVRNISQPPADPPTGTPPNVIGTQPPGARGLVDSGPVLNTTPGGDGAIRYHVLFASGPSGWVVQDYLTKIVPTVPVASVTVSPASATVPQGQTVQLTATPKDASGNPLTGRVVTWASGNTAIATVSSSGLVTGVGAGGPVTITATSEGKSGTAAITVTAVPVASVTVTPASASVPQGQTVQLTATPKDASGNPLSGRVVTWASGNTAVATVSTSGLVTGVAAGGPVTITATSEGQNGTASITVTAVVPVASVSVTPASASVPQGQTVQLTATPKDASGNPLTGRVVTWASGNTAVATVSTSGLVTGVGVGGPVTITATSEGQSGTASITVTAVPVASVTVSPTPASVTVGSKLQLTATPKDASGNPLSGRVVTWASGNTALATVDATGLVTGVAAGGPVTITATSEGQAGTAAITVTAPGTSQFNHVFIVMEENTNAADVTSTSMPYLMGLAAQYGTATQYYADTHPSIGNYLMLTTGQIITNDDSYSGPSITVDNVVRELLAAGKTWKAYAEGLPSVGYVAMNVDNGTYASRHNPVVYLSDVHDNPTQANNVVPFTQFATDLSANTLPNYAFIVPDLCNDAHDCSITVADSWLQTNIDSLVKSAQFQQDGLLLVLFDESGSDNTNGGGRVAWVAVSPSKSKRAYQSTTLYQHESTLRLTLKALGVTVFPGAAATAPDMSEFFNP